MVRRRCLFVLGVFLFALSCSSAKIAKKTEENPATNSTESPDFIKRQATSGGSEQHPSGGTLNRRLTSRAQNFNWLSSRRKSKEIVRYYVHRQFARRSQTDPGQWRPELARDIEVNRDHTEYTIFLKKGIQWQLPPLKTSKEAFSWLTEIDRELTAEDCIFAFRMAREPDVGAKILQKRFSKINKIEKVNRYAFRVTWAEPYFPSRASTLGFFPLPRWLYSRSKKGESIPESRIAENFNSHWSHRYPIGVGPYRFEQTEKTDHLTLAQYSDYDGEPPLIGQIEFKVIPEAQDAYHALKSGTLDIAGFSPQFFSNHIGERLQDSLNYKAVDKLAYHYIGWNARKRLFSEPRVRQALSHAVDRNKMIETYLPGFAHPQSGPFYHRSQATDPEVEAPKYDLKKADKPLTEAGWQDIDDDGLREKKSMGRPGNFSLPSLAMTNSPQKK
jgi:ABC-type transport system substrate-binding protein